MKKKKLMPHSGDNILLEYEQSLSGGYMIKQAIILKPVTGILPWGDNIAFIWEGTHKGEVIRVVLPRSTSETDAEIIGIIPSEYDAARGTLSHQLYDELKRILRKLN